MANKKGKIELQGLFDPPLGNEENFPVAKMKEWITEHLWLVFDKVWLNETRSRKNLWDKFEKIILWILNNDSEYEEYFTVKNNIISYFEAKFPYAKSVSLVFEILNCYPQDWENVPLCFKWWKLDLAETFTKFQKSEIDNFVGKIVCWSPEFQKFKIRENELSMCLKNWYCPPWKLKTDKPVTKKWSIKAKKEELRLSDDSFLIPKQSEWLPYIHIENDQIAIKFMIWLYGKDLIQKTFEKINQEIPPYNLTWLKDALNELCKSFGKSSPKHIIRNLCKGDGDKNIRAIRERKWRLTMRLKKFLEEQKIPEIEYGTKYRNTWMIVYVPTWVCYQKEFLFNLRPNEWRNEILRRIDERKKYAEYMDKLEILLIDSPIEWLFIIKNLESIWRRIDNNGSNEPLHLSSIFNLEEGQWIQAIRKWIDEPPKVLKITHDVEPKENFPYTNIQVITPSPDEKKIQKLSAILDKCCIDTEGSIDLCELNEFPDELLEMDIKVSFEDEKIIDTTTGEIISFEELGKDWNEFIKMSFLEWFREIRGIEIDIDESSSPGYPVKNNIEKTDDLPF